MISYREKKHTGRHMPAWYPYWITLATQRSDDWDDETFEMYDVKINDTIFTEYNEKFKQALLWEKLSK